MANVACFLLSLLLVNYCSTQECQHVAPVVVTPCQEPEPVLPPDAIIPDCDCLDDVKVGAQTTHGPVEGERLMTSSGQSIRMFRGLPYAKPPVGELQFKKPEAPEPWHETLMAKDWPPRCIQSRKIGNVPEHLPTDSLDCLYLNVFARQHPITPCGDPVMVFIHGGAFSMGSTLDYGVDGIAQRLVSKGVVVVNVQYRLGMWGFMSTGDEAQPGNLGLWDQTMALQWVQDNIAAFGGNPQKVTIFGQSAGAASVTALSTSPHSNTLFYNLIAMSGTIKAPWAREQNEVKQNTKLLFEQIGCNGTTSAESLDCLRNKTAAEHLQASKDFLQKRAGANPSVLILPFTPVDDRDFFPEPVAVLQQKAGHKPIIVGTTHMEGAFIAAPPTDQWDNFYANFNASQLEGVIEQAITSVLEDPVARKIVLTLAKHHYVKEHEKEKHRDPYKLPKHDPKKPLFKQYIEFLSDIGFIAPAYAEAAAQANAGPTWLYSFDHFNPAAFPPEHLFKGVQHAMELPYLFESTLFQKFTFNREDKTVAELFSTLWTNFAKFSNPTPMPVNGMTWDSFTTAHSNFLSIKSRPRMKYAYNKKSIGFWNELVPEIISALKTEAEPEYETRK